MKKIDGIVSIARKGGFAVVGQDNLKGFSQKLFLILLDTRAGKSLQREMTFLANKKNAEILKVENLAEKISIENCKVIGFKNKAISENIIECLKGE